MVHYVRRFKINKIMIHRERIEHKTDATMLKMFLSGRLSYLAGICDMLVPSSFYIIPAKGWERYVSDEDKEIMVHIFNSVKEKYSFCTLHTFIMGNVC